MSEQVGRSAESSAFFQVHSLRKLKSWISAQSEASMFLTPAFLRHSSFARWSSDAWHPEAAFEPDCVPITSARQLFFSRHGGGALPRGGARRKRGGSPAISATREIHSRI